MIPSRINAITAQAETQTRPSLSYRLDFERKRITGKIDNIEAIRQAIQKILYTERYAWVIYSSQYGVELDRLIGKDYEFIATDIERTISDALLVDDRVLSLQDFVTNQRTLNTMEVSFVVNTIAGKTNMTSEVLIL